MKARQIQEQRFKDLKGVYCNAQMSSKQLRQFAQPDSTGLALLKNAMQKRNLSARAYDRILKVSRTIADLEESEQVMVYHIAEAINYRNLDREGWAG
jgi:magnesium chelatase family protein